MAPCLFETNVITDVVVGSAVVDVVIVTVVVVVVTVVVVVVISWSYFMELSRQMGVQ